MLVPGGIVILALQYNAFAKGCPDELPLKIQHHANEHYAYFASSKKHHSRPHDVKHLCVQAIRIIYLYGVAIYECISKIIDGSGGILQIWSRGKTTLVLQVKLNVFHMGIVLCEAQNLLYVIYVLLHWRWYGPKYGLYFL